MKTAVKVGHGICPSKKCNATDAYFSRSAGGKLKYECRRCDTNGYSDNPRGKGEADWLSGIIDPAQAVDPKPADPAPAPTPVPAKKRAAFSMDAL